jgi:hypothetical protein
MSTELIAAIRSHAFLNYDAGGWDYLVECWDDVEILERLDGITDTCVAIVHLAKILKTLDDYRNENQPMAGWDY